MIKNIRKQILEAQNYISPSIAPKWIVGVVLIISFFCLAIISSKPVYNHDLADEMTIEFEQIEIMPTAIATRELDVSGKTEHILVNNKYTVDATYYEIFEHYDKCLKENGWELLQEDRIYDWGRDYGGKTTKYRKGDFIATIQYAGEEANYGWTYSMGISWGLYRDPK